MFERWTHTQNYLSAPHLSSNEIKISEKRFRCWFLQICLPSLVPTHKSEWFEMASRGILLTNSIIFSVCWVSVCLVINLISREILFLCCLLFVRSSFPHFKPLPSSSVTIIIARWAFFLLMERKKTPATTAIYYLSAVFFWLSNI